MVSTDVIEHHDQKQFGEEWIYFSWHVPIVAYCKGSQRRDLEAETEAGGMEECSLPA